MVHSTADCGLTGVYILPTTPYVTNTHYELTPIQCTTCMVVPLLFLFSLFSVSSTCCSAPSGLQASQDDMVLDQAAEEMRMAIREIGKITGKVGVEEILDVVFRDFCIGK